MRRLYFALLSLTIVSSVLKAQAKVVIPSADSMKKISKTGETCVPCAAAKTAAKSKPVAKKPAPKPAPPAPKPQVEPTVSLKDYQSIKDSLELCRKSMEKFKDSLGGLEYKVVLFKDSLSRRVTLPKIWIDTVYVSHINVKGLVATSLVSAGLGYAAGFFTHSHNELTATIIHTNLRTVPSGVELLRFTVPISR